MTTNAALENIRSALSDGHTNEALSLVEELLLQDKQNPTLLYLQGKAYMKKSDWPNALNAFLRAEQADPDSPAKECRAMLDEIMAFYNKDMYNQ